MVLISVARNYDLSQKVGFSEKKYQKVGFLAPDVGFRPKPSGHTAAAPFPGFDWNQKKIVRGF